MDRPSHMRPYNQFEEENVRFLVNKQVKFATLEITEVGYNKGILDATSPVRAYFLENGIHNYEKQPQGEENKRLINTSIILPDRTIDTHTSFYRPMTKKGDPRMWVYQYKQYINPYDKFIIIAKDGQLSVVNISQIDIKKLFSIQSPIHDLIESISLLESSVAIELKEKIGLLMGDWTTSEKLADTGIGRTVESLLGIQMNDSPLPDYKGIELKSFRDRSNVRKNLFTQAPDWTLSKLKSGKEIVEKYGYIPAGYNHKTLHVTLSAAKPNSQNLGLCLNLNNEWLEANEYSPNPLDDKKYQKVNDISVWTLMQLHQRLLKKHHETFWIDMETKKDSGKELFRVKFIEHTKNPSTTQFDTLLDQGKITVDFLLSRNSGGDTYSFKIASKAKLLLFPESVIYNYNR